QRLPALDGGAPGADAAREDSGTGVVDTDAGRVPSDGSSPMPDAAIPRGASCPNASAILCEDFEANDNFMGWRSEAGSAAGNMGTLTRDAVHAYGQGAMHGVVNYINLDSGWARVRRDLAVPKPDTFMRFYAYVPASSLKAMSTWYALGGLYSSSN